MSWFLTGASVIGPGHAADSVPNQDSLLLRRFNGSFLAVVCDGMGSKSQAHIGSGLACRAVYEVVRDSGFGIDSRNLVENIYRLWLVLLESVKPQDAITTCLFCWGDPSGLVRYFQLGDGRVIAPGITLKDESAAFGNETMGLGISGKYSDWFVGEFRLDAGQGAAIMTDGISEDLEPGCESELLRSLVYSMKSKSARRAKKSLVQELRAWPTPNHLDDKTIAVVIR